MAQETMLLSDGAILATLLLVGGAFLILGLPRDFGRRPFRARSQRAAAKAKPRRGAPRG